jgi:transposase InsO family protein
MERVHLDILGPFNTSEDGNRYVLMMIDQFKKWVEMAAIPEQSALTIAEKFVVHFEATFGCPLEVHTDQGRNFDGNLFKSLRTILEVAKTRTTPYHPSSNGQIERFNTVLL